MASRQKRVYTSVFKYNVRLGNSFHPMNFSVIPSMGCEFHPAKLAAQRKQITRRRHHVRCCPAQAGGCLAPQLDVLARSYLARTAMAATYRDFQPLDIP